MIKLDNTKKFYDEIKNIGFFQRLFGWNKIIGLLTESYSEIKKIEDLVEYTRELETNLKVRDEKIISQNI